MLSSSRRGFLRGLAGIGAASAFGGCCSIGRSGSGKIRLAVVGIGGKGYSDWTPMLKTGLAEVVAFCDADANTYLKCLARAKKEGYGDLSGIPFFSDYRKLLDACGLLGVEAMTISTPDHVHAPVAVQAMKMGIHVYVQKPLVRTLWELDYFNRTAKKNRVIVQMGNQGSALNSMRRCTEVLQSGILGDVTEVHVWTNRPVWPQGKTLSDYIKSRGAKGDEVPAGLNWDAFLATAKDRPYLGEFPKSLGPFHNDWKIAPNVYHAFNWRGSIDFGAGAFGDMACHTMNLPFRGLELGAVTDAECTQIESASDLIYPANSTVKLTYAARTARFGGNRGKQLPAVTLFWYDGDVKPAAAIMPKWAATHGGKVPNTGCYIIGTKGAVLMQDDYGAKCAIALDDDKGFVDVFEHEAARAVARDIPFCGEADVAVGGSSVEMQGLGEGHYGEFLRAIKGVGSVYEQTNSRCFSDIEYCIPQMEGILVGTIAQQVPGKHFWNSAAQQFGDSAANALVKPFIRDGWAF
ncbi:MAG: Gfo/Idh/MocA family oxidoreductase [Kiritimatiellia bacterium]